MTSTLSAPEPAAEHRDLTRDCLAPWEYVGFRTNGDVAPCCIRPTVGNILEQDLPTILNAPPIRQLRRDLLTGSLDEHCATCRSKPMIETRGLRDKVAARLLDVAMPRHFTPDQYVAANPDVGEPDKASRHYREFGRFEGRRLAPRLPHSAFTFDAELYLAANEDIRNIGTDPVVHYLNEGQFECRALRPVSPGEGWPFRPGIEIDFDPDAYAEANLDVHRSGYNPFSHFIEYGQFEKRRLRLRPFPASPR